MNVVVDEGDSVAAGSKVVKTGAGVAFVTSDESIEGGIVAELVGIPKRVGSLVVLIVGVKRVGNLVGEAGVPVESRNAADAGAMFRLCEELKPTNSPATNPPITTNKNITIPHTLLSFISSISDLLPDNGTAATGAPK